MKTKKQREFKEGDKVFYSPLSFPSEDSNALVLGTRVLVKISIGGEVLEVSENSLSHGWKKVLEK